MPAPDDANQPGMSDLSQQVYAQLRAIAQARLAHERPGHTLQATALVHEALMRVDRAAQTVDAASPQFIWAAAQAMRRILIEHARTRNATKRGGDFKRLSWSGGIADVADLASEEHSDKIEALDAAIVRLEEHDERAARVVRLRFFAGLSIDQTARAMDMSPRTAKRDWEYARTWLLRELRAT
ncbi:MAG TPA: ECF-type sigma factor [Phycisphaerales bacterium]|nr:ECF-type sigma factor [Phycisphaerales bacterium]